MKPDEEDEDGDIIRTVASETGAAERMRYDGQVTYFYIPD